MQGSQWSHRASQLLGLCQRHFICQSASLPPPSRGRATEHPVGAKHPLLSGRGQQGMLLVPRPCALALALVPPGPAGPHLPAEAQHSALVSLGLREWLSGRKRKDSSPGPHVKPRGLPAPIQPGWLAGQGLTQQDGSLSPATRGFLTDT